MITFRLPEDGDDFPPVQAMLRRYASNPQILGYRKTASRPLTGGPFPPNITDVDQSNWFHPANYRHCAGLRKHAGMSLPSSNAHNMSPLLPSQGAVARTSRNGITDAATAPHASGNAARSLSRATPWWHFSGNLSDWLKFLTH
jgi:hypothetical protein